MQAVTVLLFLHGDVQPERGGAQRNTHDSFAGFASSTEHLHIHPEHESEAQRFRRNIIKRNACAKYTIFVGCYGVNRQFGGILVTEPPEVGISKLVVPRHAGITDGNTVVSQSLTRQFDAVLWPLQRGSIVHFYFKGRTFVFFYTETDIGFRGLDTIVPRQLPFGQNEVGREYAEGVCDGGLFADLLPVGIPEDEFIRLTCQGAGIPVLLTVGDTAEVDSLPGTIDGTVGVEP